MKKSRVPVMCANWKMYKNIEEALAFIDVVAPVAEQSDCEALIAVPFTAIRSCADRAQGTRIIIGAQNMNDATQGAFTGEISASMLKEAGATFVIVGHSERRRLFGETNSFIHKKVQRALDVGLRPILCIGESYEERENEATQTVLCTQLREGLVDVPKTAASQLMVAYEPNWAVGTGLPANPETVHQAIDDCRAFLGELWSSADAEKVTFLYGGSVDVQNAATFLQTPNIDGLLIGSVSLDPDSFAKIISLCQNVAAH